MEVIYTDSLDVTRAYATKNPEDIEFAWSTSAQKLSIEQVDAPKDDTDPGDTYRLVFTTEETGETTHELLYKILGAQGETGWEGRFVPPGDNK